MQMADTAANSMPLSTSPAKTMAWWFFLWRSRAISPPLKARLIQIRWKQGSFRSAESKAHSDPLKARLIQILWKQGLFRSAESKVHSDPLKARLIQIRWKQGSFRSAESKAHSDPLKARLIQIRWKQGSFRLWYGRHIWCRSLDTVQGFEVQHWGFR